MNRTQLTTLEHQVLWAIAMDLLDVNPPFCYSLGGTPISGPINALQAMGLVGWRHSPNAKLQLTVKGRKRL